MNDHTPHAEDRALVTAFVRERSDAAFHSLYRAHAGAMYALALRLCGGRTSDADDVVQNAWIRALTRIEGFRWESALRTWLCGITVNCVRERLREPLFDETIPDGPAVSFDHDGRVDLESALLALAAGYRAVLVLHDIEGYTHEEIARLLDIAPGTAKSQLSRARRALRRRMGMPESNP